MRVRATGQKVVTAENDENRNLDGHRGRRSHDRDRTHEFNRGNDVLKYLIGDAAYGIALRIAVEEARPNSGAGGQIAGVQAAGRIRGIVDGWIERVRSLKPARQRMRGASHEQPIHVTVVDRLLPRHYSSERVTDKYDLAETDSAYGSGAESPYDLMSDLGADWMGS